MCCFPVCFKDGNAGCLFPFIKCKLVVTACVSGSCRYFYGSIFSGLRDFHAVCIREYHIAFYIGVLVLNVVPQLCHGGGQRVSCGCGVLQLEPVC